LSGQFGLYRISIPAIARASRAFVGDERPLTGVLKSHFSRYFFGRTSGNP